MPEVTLNANGVKVGGWTSVSIRKSMDRFSDEFSFELSNQRVGGSAGITSKQIRTAADELDGADECTIAIDGHVVLTGYIDDFGLTYDSRTANMRISGRSRAGNLEDSSAIHKGGAWSSATLQEIARDLCLPFGITVIDADNLSGAPFNSFRIEPGETVFSALNKASDMRSVVLISNADGDIEIVRAGTVHSGATLELGVNVLRGGFSKSLRGRFSVYTFKGQTQATDDWSGLKASQLKGEVEDPNVGRYRPMQVLRWKQRGGNDMGARAVWQRNVLAGRSVRSSYTVEEWTIPETGKPWSVNELARVKDDWAAIDSDRLIASLEFTQTLTDRLTSIELVGPAAYDADPNAKLPPKKRKGGKYRA